MAGRVVLTVVGATGIAGLLGVAITGIAAAAVTGITGAVVGAVATGACYAAGVVTRGVKAAWGWAKGLFSKDAVVVADAPVAEAVAQDC
jgi:hypothetical protein